MSMWPQCCANCINLKCKKMLDIGNCFTMLNFFHDCFKRGVIVIYLRIGQVQLVIMTEFNPEQYYLKNEIK